MFPSRLAGWLRTFGSGLGSCTKVKFSFSFSFTNLVFDACWFLYRYYRFFFILLGLGFISGGSRSIFQIVPHLRLEVISRLDAGHFHLLECWMNEDIFRLFYFLIDT